MTSGYALIFPCSLFRAAECTTRVQCWHPAALAKQWPLIPPGDMAGALVGQGPQRSGQVGLISAAAKSVALLLLVLIL